MATTKPRITITLTDRQYQLVKTLSESSGQSMSGFITEYLEIAEPMLEQMCVAYQRMKQADDARKEDLKRNLDAAERSLRPLVESVNAQVDFFFSNTDKIASSEDVEAGSAHASAGVVSTPLTNRGVTKVTKVRKTGLQAASNIDSSKNKKLKK